MFSWFKELLRAVERIAIHLGRIHEYLEEGVRVGADTADLEERVGAVERELSKALADAEATYIRAESKFKAARAAEERARHHARSANGAEDGEETLTEDELVAAYEEAGIPLGDEAPGPEEGMQPVPSRMERRRYSKSNALALKFGR